LQSESILKQFYLTLNPRESCSTTCIDEFGLLNRLISIAKAQDIHVGISNEEAKFCRENSTVKFCHENSAATKFCRKQFRRKILPRKQNFSVTGKILPPPPSLQD
jgi:hypothetical protein